MSGHQKDLDASNQAKHAALRRLVAAFENRVRTKVPEDESTHLVEDSSSSSMAKNARPEAQNSEGLLNIGA